MALGNLVSVAFEKLDLHSYDALEPELLRSEEAFPPGPLRCDRRDFEYVLGAPTSLAFVTRVNGAYAGNARGLAEPKADADCNKYALPRRTILLWGIVIDPPHQGRGLGCQSFEEFFACARQRGYTHLVGYFREGRPTQIILGYGGRILAKEPRWLGTDETHFYCELGLRSWQESRGRHGTV